MRWTGRTYMGGNRTRRPPPPPLPVILLVVLVGLNVKVGSFMTAGVIQTVTLTTDWLFEDGVCTWMRYTDAMDAMKFTIHHSKVSIVGPLKAGGGRLQLVNAFHWLRSINDPKIHETHGHPNPRRYSYTRFCRYKSQARRIKHQIDNDSN